MANIEFTAFINGSHNNAQGKTFVLKTSESHSRKQDDGSYESTGRTFRDVFIGQNADGDLRDWFENTIHEDGDMITVKGFEFTRPREYNGKTYYDLVVYADEIEPYIPERKTRKPAATQRKQTSRR